LVFRTLLNALTSVSESRASAITNVSFSELRTESIASLYDVAADPDSITSGFPDIALSSLSLISSVFTPVTQRIVDFDADTVGAFCFLVLAMNAFLNQIYKNPLKHDKKQGGIS